MKHIISTALFGMSVFALCFGALALPQAAEAAPPAHAKAWGYYKMSPGHLKKADRYEYQYRYEEDDDDEWEDMDDRMSDFHAWIRDYIRQWFMMRYGWSQPYSYYTSEDARVVTGTVTNVEDDRATLRAQAYLGSGDDEAEVWFEYGTSANDLDDTSSSVTIDDDETVTRTITGLDEDTRYYYRAVIEDEDGDEHYGSVRSFWTRDTASSGDDEPTLSTSAADDVEDDRADLRGVVYMNDFDSGIVFFVYGTDESQIEDVADDYDEYDDIDEDGEDLRKVKVDNDLDGSASYTRTVTSLDDDTTYYYAIGVEYEDEDGDPVLKLGSVRSFSTDDTSEDEPDVTTRAAEDVEDDRADLRGSVDMSDYDNGFVFFVYGTDKSRIEDVADDYDEFDDIDEDGEKLQKFEVDDDLDGSDSYTELVTGLDNDTRYYFAIGVEYLDEDDEPTLTLGTVEDFRTDE